MSCAYFNLQNIYLIVCQIIRYKNLSCCVKIDTNTATLVNVRFVYLMLYMNFRDSLF